MEAPQIDPDSSEPASSHSGGGEANTAGPQAGSGSAARVDWEGFYGSYRKPGYVPGFEIVNKLGGGMFGLVFKARKASIGKDYAIKFLKVDDDSVRDAVMREVDNVSFFAQIDHPNLVSIEDKGSVDGIPFLIMSYAGEQTLQKRLQAGDMTRDDAMHIFVQAARGVQALHDHSLVHFDLKPANVFLKGDVARVGDYGLSKLVSASRNSLSFGRGTPYYMAPELLQRRGDARSDVYSLGILLYECLYGEVPFRGDSEWEVLRKHETATPEFPATALASDREVILNCLRKRPEDRYQTAAELLRALQAPVALGESMMFGSARPGDTQPGNTQPGNTPAGASPVGATAEPASPTHPAGPVGFASLGHEAAPASASPPPLPLPAAGERPQLDPLGSGDGAASPRGMPWREQDQEFAGTGWISGMVRIVFSLLDLSVRAMLLPVRFVSWFAGNGVTWLIRLPFRMLSVAARLVGTLVVLALIVLVLVTVFSLVVAA